MRVLITGGCGFLGRRIAQRLADRGDQAIAFDTAIDPGLSDIPNVSVVEGDITNMAHIVEVCQQAPIDAVVHCAGIVGVMFTIKNPAKVIDVNVNGSINLFEAMRLFNIKRVIHISSIEVYGDFETSPVTEDHPLRPLMAYGITKTTVEQLGRSYQLLQGIDCINLRGSWIYGPDFPRPRLPNVLLKRVLCGEAVHLETGADSVMDYIHAEDFIGAVVAALDLKNHRYDAYNIGSGVGTSLSELAALVKQMCPAATVSVGPGRYQFQPGLPMRVQGALDITRAKEELGFSPKYSIQRGLEEYLSA